MYSRPLNKFELWILRRIFNKAFRQGAYHQRNAETVYGLIAEDWKIRFYEDSKSTREQMLQETFDAANSKAL